MSITRGPRNAAAGIGALVAAVVAAAAANGPPTPEGPSVASRVPSRTAEDGTGLGVHDNGKAQR